MSWKCRDKLTAMQPETVSLSKRTNVPPNVSAGLQNKCVIAAPLLLEVSKVGLPL